MLIVLKQKNGIYNVLVERYFLPSNIDKLYNLNLKINLIDLLIKK